MTNILFMMADELSWWALGHHNPAVHTPNLDRLAASSIRFAAAYTPSPICVPARAAIACGQHLHDIGYWSSAEPYDGAVPSFFHRMQQAGVETTSIGKLHYRFREDDTGFDQQIEPIHVLNGVGWIQGLMRRDPQPYTSADAMAREIGPGQSSYIDFDRRVTDAAVNWLADPLRHTRPWCTFVSWLSPHFPLIAPEEYYALYDPLALQSAPDHPPKHPILDEIRALYDHDRHFDQTSRGIARAGYFGLCSFLDAQVGQVLDALEKNGLADDCVIVFTSDHGDMLGEKGFWAKSVMYESAVRVPLMIAGPNIEPDACATPVSLIDLAPTLCRVAGVSAEDFPGDDLLAPLDPDRTAMSAFHDGGASVGLTMVRWNDAGGAWKLVHYAEGHPPQLFNLTRDPTEDENLATSEPDALAEALIRLYGICDPEQENRQAHADQAARIAELGGWEAIKQMPVFDYTPADSR